MTNSVAAVAPPKEPPFHLELGKEISRSSLVTVNTCLSREAYAKHLKIDRDSAHKPLVVLLQAEYLRPDGTKLIERAIIKDVLNVPSTMISLKKSGVHHVYGVLVQLTLGAKQNPSAELQRMQERFLARNIDRSYQWYLEPEAVEKYDPHVPAPDPSDVEAYGEWQRRNWSYRNFHDTITRLLAWGPSIKVVGITSIDVTVPEGVFAKAPPKWWKAWVTAYVPERLKDTCDLNRRGLYAIFVQPFVWTLWECAKRLWTFLYGFRMALATRKGSSTVMRRAFSPMLVFAPPSAEIWQGWNERPYLRGYSGLLAPSKLILYAVIASTLWIFREQIGTFFYEYRQLFLSIAVAIGILIAALVVFVGILLVAGLSIKVYEFFRKGSTQGKAPKAPQKLSSLERKLLQRRAEREEQIAEILSGRAEVPYAVCTSEVSPTERAALARRKSVELQFGGFKQSVCQEFEMD